LLSGVSFARRIASIACIGKKKIQPLVLREWEEAKIADLVEQNVVGTAERATSLLKSFANCIDLRNDNHRQ